MEISGERVHRGVILIMTIPVNSQIARLFIPATLIV